LGDFTWDGSDGEKFLEAICPGRSLTLRDLTIIGLVCETLSCIKFHRDFRRSRALVVKWLSEHYSELSPLVSFMKFDANKL
jgi:hypothetical protein